MAKPQVIAQDDVYETLFVEYGIDPRDDTLHERSWISDELYFFRFANRRDATNCLIEVDKDAM